MRKENFNLSRRKFLEFFGYAAAGASLAPAVFAKSPLNFSARNELFEPLAPSSKDDFITAPGLNSSILIKWGDPITANQVFGCNNDYLNFIPLDSKNLHDGILIVNHEYPDPLFIHGQIDPSKKSKENVEAERSLVGFSLLRIRKEKNKWKVVYNDSRNRRIDAKTMIPFAWKEPIKGAHQSEGTLGNCAGGKTPWGTFLSCEENYNEFYGNFPYPNKTENYRELGVPYFGWYEKFKNPPEHYGWIVEIEPKTGKSKKLVSMGRFRHEGATCKMASDKRCVVYMGDDDYNQHIYKFIASRPGSLEEGTLFAADVKNGKWLELNWNTNEILKKNFKNQTEVLVYAAYAARMIGATEMNRPEDLEIDPKTGAVIISLTLNPEKGDGFGSLLKIVEKNNDPLSLEFESSTFISGGKDNDFACPDNLAFDKSGNLWMCCDISGAKLGAGAYAQFGTNALYFIPMTGPQSGKPMRVATALINAELTGLLFSEDHKTLFLSVQHPGELSKSIDQPLSRWPDFGKNIPRSAVVTLEGPLLDKLVNYRAT